MTTSATPVSGPASVADATVAAGTEAAVRATILDYFEGWYDADVDRMRRALHPLLAKRSFRQDPEHRPVLATTTSEQMFWFTGQGNGQRSDPQRRHLEIDIVDISGMMATAIVHSYDYVEYLHLVDTLDGWRIVNALWRYVDGRDPVP